MKMNKLLTLVLTTLAMSMVSFEASAQYYCEWVYVYDGWGNYYYVWQCW